MKTTSGGAERPYPASGGTKAPPDIIISVPPAAAALEQGAYAAAYHASDPPGTQLGSGGGTACLLAGAWRDSCSRGADMTFNAWLSSSVKLIIHGSGQSRRLPAYAAEGKPLLPIPRMDTLSGQKIDQRLLDLQKLEYGRMARHAPPSYRMIVTCGDALVRAEGCMPVFPQVDVLIAGIAAAPEEASNHGVMFCPADNPGALSFFLQKPPPEEISRLAAKHTYFLDTGVWFFSAAAASVLMRKCGWNPQTMDFDGGMPRAYELFDRFGQALGSSPVDLDQEINRLSCAVLPLTSAKFFHFGTNRSIMDSVAQLSHPAEARRSFGHAGASEARNTIILNSHFEAEPASHIWIENSCVPASWKLAGRNVVTGFPHNSLSIELPEGVCLDCIDVRGGGFALRPYGFDDLFKGDIRSESTLWMGSPAPEWFAARGIGMDEFGFCGDIQKARLFPVAESPENAEDIIRWMIFAPEGGEGDGLRRKWLESKRVSAEELLLCADVGARIERRRGLIGRSLREMTHSGWNALFSETDLTDLAAGSAVPPDEFGRESEARRPSLSGVHAAMFRAVKFGESGDAPFRMLRRLMTDEIALRPVSPSRSLLDDQIIWGRSPARLDLAGGWSDTPPYCLEHGGRVVNVAVDLNGQPPVQTFARICPQPHIVLHSIDLGISETISDYEELTKPSALGGFSIARAALRLAGFDPAFNASGGDSSLRRQLEHGFGGGIELSMLAAIPKGSGLGTSSILAATILGVLGEMCSLNWSHNDIFARTSVLEQILTSGGGWQDQIGGITPGLKIISTRPDISQMPDIRWLPQTVLQEAVASGRALLYYTGITRVARNILGEIVRNIFLNDSSTVSVISDIAANADFIADAALRNDSAKFMEGIKRSWQLNNELDAGTCSPPIAEIMSAISVYRPAAKLLGAGGGGYMLIIARDAQSAAGIRDTLMSNPGNIRARFVDMSISHTGLQITRS